MPNNYGERLKSWIKIFQNKNDFKIVFWGCLGSQSTIPFGTPAEIQREVEKLCREMGRGGGYILSSAKALQPETSIENAVEVVEAFTNQGD